MTKEKQLALGCTYTVETVDTTTDEYGFRIETDIITYTDATGKVRKKTEKNKYCPTCNTLIETTYIEEKSE